MKARILPREEWGRLESTILLDDESTVLVVEDGARIVASLKALRVTHLEGLWIAPEYRGNAGVGRRLLRALGALVGRWEWVWAGCDSEPMKRILERLGGKKLALDSYVFKVEA